MSKIELTDILLDMMIKMSEGNPGAATAISFIVRENEEIDPQSAFGKFSAILALDKLGVYGSDIYILWSDKCGKDTRRLIMLLRANQLGFISSDVIIEMSKDQARQVNLTEEEFQELDKKVCEQLEEFKR